MKFPRSAGILLHISSLPGRFGIGDLGPSAYRFADFLQLTEQKIWQILPVCPPAGGHSPYSSYSVFAGNPSFVSPEKMIEQGWGTQSDLESIQHSLSQRNRTQPEQADFDLASSLREQFFRITFDSVQSKLAQHAPFQSFREKNQYWLSDFSLFKAIGEKFDSFDWCQWPADLAQRNPQALNEFQVQHQQQIEYAEFVQFIFDSQWQELKTYCNELGIQIYGDIPIFVDYQSVEVWANQEQFQLDDSGRPEFVAGVPPDYFSKTGQKWGNPLYRWDVMEADGFSWWIDRFQRSMEQFDIVRVDHFRGFESYWKIPAESPTAVNGEWIPGPGAKPFRAAENRLGQLPIVAEDLGLITEPVHQLRDELGFPSMRVMQFGYGSKTDTFHRPGYFPENCFAYTGTHDNETLVGWYQNQMKNGSSDTQDLLAESFDFSQAAGLPVNIQMIATLMQSKAVVVVIPLQDYLGLDNAARMNIPAKADGNWGWKLTDESYLELVDSIRNITKSSNRSRP